MQPTPTPVPARRRRARVLPANLRASAITMLAFTGLLYVSEAVDVALNGTLEDDGGIVPREVHGLDGVLFAPLLHDDWGHLLANTLPVLLLGFLAMAGGLGQFLAVTATIWVVGGLGTWLTGGENTIHIGASGLIFGWLTFLLVRGFFARSFGQIVLAVVLFMAYGGALLGVLPGEPGISWQGHLFGALGGVLAARLVASADRRPARVAS